MNVGASTANLYPMPVEQALGRLLALGFRDVEVFLNTASELEPAFLDDLHRQADEAGARIVSFHPFLSGFEPFLLFSEYERRYRDYCREYERFFEAAARLGAGLMVLHGDRLPGVLPEEESVARYAGLYAVGQRYGVTLAQENVVRFRASDLGYIAALRRGMGDRARFVFDLKQCRRAGHQPDEVIEAMGSGLIHVHISDHDADRDCLMPGRGTVDYPRLLTLLQRVGYTGPLILELYRKNFGEEQELVQGRRFLETIQQRLDESG